MSLATRVDLARADVRVPVIAGVGGTLALLLSAAAIEQSLQRGEFAVAATLAALAMIAGTAIAAWRAAVATRDRPEGLLIDAEGRVRVLIDGVAHEVVVTRVQRLPGLLHLAFAWRRSAPPGVAGDAPDSLHAQSQALLAHRRLAAAQWNALCRWVVWTRRGGGVAVRPAKQIDQDRERSMNGTERWQ